MTRPYKFKPGMRERVSERMIKLNSDPEFAEQAARRASIRMRAIHEAARMAFTERVKDLDLFAYSRERYLRQQAAKKKRKEKRAIGH